MMLCSTKVITFGLMNSSWSPFSNTSQNGLFLTITIQIKNNLLTPISHQFHLTSILRPENFKTKLTVCIAAPFRWVILAQKDLLLGA